MGNLGAGLSKKHKAVVSCFLSAAEDLPFQTLSEIASKARVSEPTVIRFVRLLGIKALAQFQGQLERIVSAV
jgi:DNA-binding MurR/RpiR family transcriptional regulator